MRPTGTTVICCYTPDRWELLERAVESAAAQRDVVLDTVLVVDHHEELRRRAEERWADRADVRVVANTFTRGLSGARNTGVAHAAGDVVLFLDDDASAEDGWAARLIACFEDPRVMVAGGRVDPRWESGRRPGWFPEEFGWVVGCSYTGQPEERAEVRNPIGASMAVRRTAFDVAGGFHDGVGRVGTLPVGCEETEFCLRVADRLPDARVVWEPASRVDHVVPLTRARLRYFVSRCYHEGRSKAAMVAILAGSRVSQAALDVERTYVRRTLPAAVRRYLAGGLRGRFADLAACGVLVLGLTATAWGYLLVRVGPGRAQGSVTLEHPGEVASG